MRPVPAINPRRTKLLALLANELRSLEANTGGFLVAELDYTTREMSNDGINQLTAYLNYANNYARKTEASK